MSLRPIGQRVAVKLVETDIFSAGGIIIPNKRNQHFNKLGRVLAVGDGKVGKDQHTMFVKKGDLCFFQLEEQQASNVSYVDREEGLIYFLHNLDMIGTLKRPVLELDSFHVVGSWILVKVAMRSSLSSSTIILPSSDNTTHELQTYTIVQVGSGVKLGVEVGQELSLARSRCNPIWLGQELYGWIEERFVYGAMA